MKRKQLLVNRDRMYVLTQDEAGRLFLEVEVGGLATVTHVIPLTKEEEANYQTNGQSELDEIAWKVCKGVGDYEARRVI